MKRSKFNLSNTKIFSCDMGKLIPICWFETLPGDTVQMSTSALVRAQALLAPVMHSVDVRIHHWFVPNRIIWDSWEDFITGGPNGTSTPEPPWINNGGGDPQLGGVADYLGIPPGAYPPQTYVSALPFRAYNLIWNEWYRDQDLQTEVAISKGDSVDNTTFKGLLNCAWEKDYFTAARPWEQKGPAVTIPIGTSAPIKGIGFYGTPSALQSNQAVRETDPASNPTYANAVKTSVTDGISVKATTNVGASTRPDVHADLTNASAVTVTSLREAMAIQRYEEARARYGSRYSEYLRYLGVRSSDARLQRPEYLGGGRQRIQFSEVLQTGPGAAADSAVGNLKGHGITALRSNRFRRFFEEHGIVMSLMSVRPKTIYMNGIERKWFRSNKDLYWQKELEHIGQQGIMMEEVWSKDISGTVFGYSDRYAEYRSMPSSVAGEFRSTLNFWHMARDFASAPALNASFVSCVPTKRDFAVSTVNCLLVQAKHHIVARRLVSGSAQSFIY